MPDPLVTLFIVLLIFGIVGALFWPDRGLWFRWQNAQRVAERARREDVLKHVYKCEMDNLSPTLESIAGVLQIRRSAAAELVAKMQAEHLLKMENGGFGLTLAGRETALHTIRVHRLWERHLADETGYAEATWHKQAERTEHLLSPTDANALSDRLGNPAYDPHGDPIPTAAGGMVAHPGQPLTKLARNQPARIVHLEDEPAIVYAQLVAEGLHPGMVVRTTESTPAQIRFWSEVGEHVLAPIVAANISVVPIPEEEHEPTPARRLDDLAVGETGQVLSLSPRCRGTERRRFMDLGILPGTQITAEFASPGGDPTAYRIRDTLIALRRNQAALINMRIQEMEEQNGGQE